MQYSKYFGSVLRYSGIPQLSQTSFQTYMNIVHLEGTIHGLKKAREKLKPDEQYKFDLIIFSVGRSLTLLTRNLPPSELLEKLIRQDVY